MSLKLDRSLCFTTDTASLEQVPTSRYAIQEAFFNSTSRRAAPGRVGVEAWRRGGVEGWRGAGATGTFLCDSI